jgi:hypothetical protein
MIKKNGLQMDIPQGKKCRTIPFGLHKAGKADPRTSRT